MSIPPIAGFLPLSLVDYPGQACAVIFLQGCNLRCPYCHNPDLISIKNINHYKLSTIFDELAQSRGIIKAITVTGGEPCIHPNLQNLFSTFKEQNFQLKLDTNGTFPNVLSSLLNQNLVDFVAMDIKAPLDKSMSTATGKNHKEPLIRRSLEILSKSNIFYEIRTTLYKNLSIIDLESIQSSLPDSCSWVLQKCHNVPGFYNSQTTDNKPILSYKNITYRGFV